jgi:outer membrane protein assembly factor BamB
VASGAAIFVETSRGTPSAVDIGTGQARWRHTLDPSAQLSSPDRLHVGGILYLVMQGNPLFALAASIGREEWRATSLAEAAAALPRSQWPVTCVPGGRAWRAGGIRGT